MSSNSPAKYTRTSSETRLSPASRKDLSRTRSEMPPSHHRRDSESRRIRVQTQSEVRSSSHPSNHKTNRPKSKKKSSISTEKSIRHNASLTLRRRRALEEAKNKQYKIDADRRGDKKNSKSFERKATSLRLQQENTKQHSALTDTTLAVNL